MSFSTSNDVRVVSLLPSATEIICLAGAEHLLVGRSHECDYPSSIKHLPMLTSAINGTFTTSRDVHNATCAALEAGKGLYSIDSELLISLKPTVIVTQDLCEVCSIDLVTVERVVHRSNLDPKPVIISLNPKSIHEVISDIIRVGEAVGTSSQAKETVDKLLQRLADLTAQAAGFGPAKLKKVAFLEWTDPIFNGGHWTPALIEVAGGVHPLNPVPPGEDAAGPSFVVPPEAITELDPDVVIVCPCGLDIPMTKREMAPLTQSTWWHELRAVKAGNVFLVDGNAHFNRPGPRLLDALQFLIGVLHEKWELIPEGFEWELMGVLPDNKATENGGVGSASLDSDKVDVNEDAKHACASDGKDSSVQHDGNRVSQQPDVEQQQTAIKLSKAASQPGFHSAPSLPHDVEECYEAAAAANKNHYRDPLSGYQCFTESGLKQRGTCCGNRCRHCPYGHFRVVRKGTRINRITATTLLIQDSYAAPSTNVHLLAVAAGEESSAAMKIESLRSTANHKDVVLLVAVDPDSRQVWTHQQQAKDEATSPDDVLSTLMDVCLKLRLSMVAVPVSPQDAHKAGGNTQVALHVMHQAKSVLGDSLKELSWLSSDHMFPAMPWLDQSKENVSWHDVKVQLGM